MRKTQKLVFQEYSWNYNKQKYYKKTELSEKCNNI